MRAFYKFVVKPILMSAAVLAIGFACLALIGGALFGTIALAYVIWGSAGADVAMMAIGVLFALWLVGAWIGSLE